MIKRKEDKLYVKWKSYDSSFNIWIDKKNVAWMREYFPEPNSSWRKAKAEWGLFNYATKADLKNEKGVDTSEFAKKIDLAGLTFNVDKLDIDKLKNVRP